LQIGWLSWNEGVLCPDRIALGEQSGCRSIELCDDSRFDGAISEPGTSGRGLLATRVAGSDRARRWFVNSDSDHVRRPQVRPEHLRQLMEHQRGVQIIRQAVRHAVVAGAAKVPDREGRQAFGPRPNFRVARSPARAWLPQAARPSAGRRARSSSSDSCSGGGPSGDSQADRPPGGAAPRGVSRVSALSKPETPGGQLPPHVFDGSGEDVDAVEPLDPLASKLNLAARQGSVA